MRILPSLLVLLALPLGAQPLTVGTEAPVADAQLLPAADQQGPPSIATNGTDFFVVWQDGRLNGSIFGARIDAAGRLIDPAGIVLSDRPGDLQRVQVSAEAFPHQTLQSRPQVVWSGNDYVVVWTSSRTVRAVRVAASGEILQRETDLTANAYWSAIAADGNTFLLLFAQSQWPFKAYVRRLSPSLQPIGDDVVEPRVTVMAPGSGLYPGLEGYSIVATGAGHAVFPLSDSIANPYYRRSAAATDGESLVVLQQNYRFTFNEEAIRTDVGGNTIRRITLPVQATLIVWTGSEYHLIAGRQTVLRLDRDLNILWQYPGVAGAVQAWPRSDVVAASNGSRTLLAGRGAAWGVVSGAEAIYATLVDEGGRRRAGTSSPAETIVSQSAVPQIHPAVAATAQTLLTAWYEPKENELVSRVRAARVTPEGQHLDGQGIVLSETATPVPGNPVVGSDEDGSLVVWDESDGHRIAQRIGADGVLQTRTSFAGTQWYGCRDPHQSMAFDGSEYLLVSHCGRGANGGPPIVPAQAIRLSRTGVPIDSQPSALSAVPGYDPKVIWSGKDFFAAAEDSTNEGICGTVTAYQAATPSQSPNGAIAIGGQRYSFDTGDVLHNASLIAIGTDVCLRNAVVSQGQIFEATVTGSDPSRIIGTFVMSSGVIRKNIVVASGSSALTQSAIATNGKTIFTAWKDGAQTTLGDLHGRVFSLDGDVLSGGAADTPGLLLTAGLNSAHPSLAWDGNFYVLSWESTPQGSTTSDLMIRRFREDGSTPDAAPVTLSATPFTDGSATLVPFGNTLAAVYTREAIEPAYGGVSRVFVRRVGASTSP